jgi:hypothetical protein
VLRGQRLIEIPTDPLARHDPKVNIIIRPGDLIVVSDAKRGARAGEAPATK